MKKFLCFALVLCLALAPMAVFADYDNGDNGYEYEYEYDSNEEYDNNEEYSNDEEYVAEECDYCVVVCDYCTFECEYCECEYCEYECECCEYCPVMCEYCVIVCDYCVVEYDNGEEYDADEYNNEEYEVYNDEELIGIMPIDAPVDVDPLYNVPVRMVDGVEFVAFRAAANAFGFYELTWYGPTSTVTVVGLEDGSFAVYAVDGFNDDGTVFVPWHLYWNYSHNFAML